MSNFFSESVGEQKHAGITDTGKNWWHTNDNGNYWSGWSPYEITPEQLFICCQSTIQDLMKNHPGLIRNLNK